MGQLGLLKNNESGKRHRGDIQHGKHIFFIHNSQYQFFCLALRSQPMVEEKKYSINTNQDTHNLQLLGFQLEPCDRLAQANNTVSPIGKKDSSVVTYPSKNKNQYQGPYSNSFNYYQGLKKRQQKIIDALANQEWIEGEDHRKRLHLGVLKIYSSIDSERGLQYLWDAVHDPRPWWCFNSYTAMEAILRIGDRLPAELTKKIKKRIFTALGSNRGFTENHKLQYQTVQYLVGQTWPDGAVLANGLSPLQGKKEAEIWINDWIDRTVSLGMMEYDSVNYHSFYFLCMTTLYDYVKDPLMRRKCWMMMQLLIADWAPEYLQGNWVGAHSREKFNQVTHTTLNSGTAILFGYLFFGNSPFHPELKETFFASLAPIQDFRPLAILGNIATDRTKPYEHWETKAPRKGFGINMSELPTFKYTYMTEDYSLGTSYGDLTAVENHRWDLTWVSEKNGSTCFFINPSYSASQLLKYFDSTPKEIVPAIVHSRPYYEDPYKWIEGSPFEELFQYKNTLIALYSIPKGERNNHVNGFFPKIINQRILDTSGWIFCQADHIYFAIRPLTKGTWFEESKHFRLTLEKRKTGIIMEIGRLSDYASFDSFKEHIKNNSLKINRKQLQVTYKNTNGDSLSFRYPDQRFINGSKINFKQWPLFKGPFVNSEKGSKIVSIEYGGEKVILDFNTYTVRYTIKKT